MDTYQWLLLLHILAAFCFLSGIVVAGIGAAVAGRIATGVDTDAKSRSTIAAPVADRPVATSMPALRSSLSSSNVSWVMFSAI